MGKIFEIAIDGHAGVGKSTTAKAIADFFGYTHINSGDIYRAITYVLLSKYENEKQAFKKGLNEEQLNFLHTIRIENHHNIFFYMGEVCKLRTDDVNVFVPYIAQVKEVREHVHTIQDRLIQQAPRGIVMDGRDIGSNIMPNADLKVYLTASAEIRAMRRFKECGGDYDEILAQITSRDYMDTHRKHAPLIKTADALEINNDHLKFDEQVKIITDRVEEIKRKSPDPYL
ncbi:cytidylate kinase [Trachipleistophora hominis]|uniref:(d)CMP kinase n=1 Tax=Trachipleistophora hominis TaxID=72359 RepID=L7JZ10_TRAHO|nr:cytidylate kinase [Trachipleistophora hominis]